VYLGHADPVVLSEVISQIGGVSNVLCQRVTDATDRERFVYVSIGALPETEVLPNAARASSRKINKGTAFVVG